MQELPYAAGSLLPSVSTDGLKSEGKAFSSVGFSPFNNYSEKVLFFLGLQKLALHLPQTIKLLTMSYSSILIHCVWSTKNRAPLLKNSHYRYELFNHIRNYSKSKGILIDHIGGFTNHIHILLFLKPDQSLMDVEKLIKGESSYWYSKMKYGALIWQDDYFAISVSLDRLDTVRRYIRRQEEHHKRYSFDEEYDFFMQMLH